VAYIFKSICERCICLRAITITFASQNNTKRSQQNKRDSAQFCSWMMQNGTVATLFFYYESIKIDIEFIVLRRLS